MLWCHTPEVMTSNLTAMSVLSSQQCGSSLIETLKRMTKRLAGFKRTEGKEGGLGKTMRIQKKQMLYLKTK